MRRLQLTVQNGPSTGRNVGIVIECRHTPAAPADTNSASPQRVSLTSLLCAVEDEARRNADQWMSHQ